MIYYPFYVGDYMTHTAHLTDIQDLAFRRMLDMVYLHERPLPDCPKKLSRMIRMTAHEHDVELVAGEFFTKTPEGYVSKRAEKQILGYHKRIEGGIAGAKSRWGKVKANQEVTDAAIGNLLPPLCQSKSKSKSKSNKTLKQADGKAAAMCVSDLVALGVNQQHATDWLAVRKAKGKPLTQTAWKAIEREAAKAGISAPDAVEIAATEGWQGFKAAWLHNASQDPTFAEKHSSTSWAAGLLPQGNA